MIVACVLWEGDFRTRTYNINWVHNLKNMVERQLSIKHDFVCFTNVKKRIDGINTVKIPNNIRGWWAKMNIFNPELLPKDELVLYLDLDILILKSLIPIIKFWQHSDYFILAPDMGSSNGKRTICKYNSSVMLFTSGRKAINDMYLDFISRPGHWSDKFRGDQDYIGYKTGHLPTFPKDWFIKIKNVKNGKRSNIPKGTKIMLMNPIKNDAASKKFKWINDYWNVK